MDELLPDLFIITDLLGAGVTLWLGLHLLLHGWGWHRSRATVAGAALLAAALPFVGAATVAITAAAPEGALALALRAFLVLPLPLALLLARRLAPGVLAVRDRYSLALALVAAAVALALLLWLGPLDPALAARQGDALFAYAFSLALTLFLLLRHVGMARRTLHSPPERRALALLALGALLAAPGLLLLAADLTLSLDGARVQGWLAPLGAWAAGPSDRLRLIGSALRLAGAVALAGSIIQQARAEAAPHLIELAHSLLVTVLMLLLFLAVGGAVVWYFALPRWLLGLFMLLALITDALDSGARGWMERLLHRGESGKLRRTLRQTADQLADQATTPPALRALLVRLGRQLNSPQLAFAQRADGGAFRIVAALRPAWRGQTIQVAHPDEWAERPAGGWSFPVSARGQPPIGLLVSEETGPLSPVQVQLLREGAAEIVSLMEEWGRTGGRREALAKAVAEYRTHADAMDERLRSLATPPPAPPNLTGQVASFLRRFSEGAATLGAHPLAQLTLVSRILPPGQAGSAEARGNAARVIVQHLVEQLRPLQVELPTRPDDLWLPYLVLTRLYIHNQPEAEFRDEFALSALRVRRAKRRGIERIARHLGEMEAAMRQRAAPEGSAPPLSLPRPGSPPPSSGASAPPKKPGLTMPSFGRKEAPPASDGPPKKPGLTMPSFGRKEAPPSPTAPAKETPPPKSLKERFGGMTGSVTGALRRGDGSPPTPKPGGPVATIPTGSRARAVPKPGPAAPAEPEPGEGDDWGDEA